MSLDKAIEHNKEHRKKYRGAKDFDPRTRNHGDDYWANDNRTYKNDKRLEEAEEKMEEENETISTC